MVWSIFKEFERLAYDQTFTLVGNVWEPTNLAKSAAHSTALDRKPCCILSFLNVYWLSTCKPLSFIYHLYNRRTCLVQASHLQQQCQDLQHQAALLLTQVSTRPSKLWLIATVLNAKGHLMSSARSPRYRTITNVLSLSYWEDSSSE